MNLLFFGIDPGLTGAVACITRDRDIILIEDWPGNEIMMANSMRSFVEFYRAHKFAAALERVHAMPKQGVSSTFKFGTNYGIWKGMLAALNIPYMEPTPQTWQKGVIAKSQDKAPAMAAAQRIWPDVELRGPRGGLKHGRADALLIADWCRRQY